MPFLFNKKPKRFCGGEAAGTNKSNISNVSQIFKDAPMKKDEVRNFWVVTITMSMCE